jgi:hypothetical protein
MLWVQTTNENISPSVINRLVKELKESQKSPLEGIDVVINEENITDVQADVEGPGSPLSATRSPRRRHLRGWLYLGH